MQWEYAWPTLILVAVAVLSVVADWRRHRRREADRANGTTGWFPWPLVTIIALIAAGLCAKLWLQGD